MAGLPGAAGVVLPSGVVPLDRPRAVFEAMLEGWATQQRARFLRQAGTIGPRLDLVRRFARFSGQYPWQWEPQEAEAFFAGLGAAGVLRVCDRSALWLAGPVHGVVRRRAAADLARVEHRCPRQRL